MAKSLLGIYKKIHKCPPCFLTTKFRQQHNLSSLLSTSCWSQQVSSFFQTRRPFGNYYDHQEQQQEGWESTSTSLSSAFSVVDDDDKNYDNVEGMLIGRIIPRGYLAYTKTKPYQRRPSNELYWKDLVDQYMISKLNNNDVNELFSSTDDAKNVDSDEEMEKDEDQVVVLDINFETKVLLQREGETCDENNDSSDNNRQSSSAAASPSLSSPILVQLHMQRKPYETANRTLRRMELSIQRKIIQGYRYGSNNLVGQRAGIHVIRESSIASSSNNYNDFPPTSRIMIMGGGSLGDGGHGQNQSCSSSSSFGENDENDASDDDLDGYRDDYDLSSSSSSTTENSTTRLLSGSEGEENECCRQNFDISNTMTIDGLLHKLNKFHHREGCHHHNQNRRCGADKGSINDDGKEGEGCRSVSSVLYLDGLIIDNDHNIVTAPTSAIDTDTGSNRPHGHRRHFQNRIALQIESLPPTILKVQTYEDFKAKVFVGIPLVVETKLLHSFRKRPLIVWLANDDVVAFDCNSYTPTMNDVGKQVSVYVMPLVHSDYDARNQEGEKDKGGTDVDRFLANHQDVVYEVYQYENLVEQRPTLPIIERRLAWLPRSLSSQPDSANKRNNTLRIMSYNLLADEYAKREVDRQLMYGHCQEQDIVKTRRMPLLVYEILIHQPDIVCLQEVDADVYKRLLFPVLKSQGYNGFYSPKVSAQLEGCAMFWNLDVFQKEPLRREQFALRDLVKNSNIEIETGAVGNDDSTTWASMKDIHRLLDLKPDLQTVVNEKVGQVLQVASLRLKDSSWETNDKDKNRIVVVGNTHLFYHPLAHHVRLIQMYAICMQIDRSRRRAAIDASRNCGSSTSSSRSTRPTITPSLSPFFICGDMNSDPLSGCVRLLMNRLVESYHHETWKFLHEYSWEQGEKEFLLEHGFIGNDVDDEPVYQDEAFCDAVGDDTGTTTSSVSLGDTEKTKNTHQQQQREEETDSSIRTSSSSSLLFPLESELRDINPPIINLPETFPEIELGYEVIPEFTNYAVDFAETLDYIFASKPSTGESSGFELLSSAFVPPKKEMKELCVAMPNANMPSDHVSIACDFKWVAK